MSIRFGRWAKLPRISAWTCRQCSPKGLIGTCCGNAGYKRWRHYDAVVRGYSVIVATYALRRLRRGTRFTAAAVREPVQPAARGSLPPRLIARADTAARPTL